jgi:hypothetical protein
MAPHLSSNFLDILSFIGRTVCIAVYIEVEGCQHSKHLASLVDVAWASQPAAA